MSITVAPIRDLTDDERDMIVYFHKERGDLTRWCDWEAVQPILSQHHPELLKAVKDVEIAEKMLDLAVRSIIA